MRNPAPPVTITVLPSQKAAALVIANRPTHPGVPILCVPLDRPVDALFPADLGLPAGLLVEFLVADAQLLDVAVAGPKSILALDDFRALPIPLVDTDIQDQVSPLAYRDVLAVAVDVFLTGLALKRDVHMSTNAVGRKAQVTLGLEIP